MLFFSPMQIAEVTSQSSKFIVTQCGLKSDTAKVGEGSSLEWQSPKIKKKTTITCLILSCIDIIKRESMQNHKSADQT